MIVRPLRRFIVHNSWFALLLTLLGVPSFILPTLFQRSVSVSVGVAFGVLVHFSQFWGTIFFSFTNLHSRFVFVVRA